VLGVALDQADVADHGALLERDRTALDLEVLDHDHGIARGQRVAVAVADLGAFALVLGTGRPLVGAMRANQQRAIGIGVALAAARAIGKRVVHASIIAHPRARPPFRGGRRRSASVDLPVVAPAAVIHQVAAGVVVLAVTLELAVAQVADVGLAAGEAVGPLPVHLPVLELALVARAARPGVDAVAMERTVDEAALVAHAVREGGDAMAVRDAALQRALVLELVALLVREAHRAGLRRG